MIRKSYILSLFILILGFTLSLTNGFADEVPELIFEVRIPESEAYIQGNGDIRRGSDSIFGTPDFEKMRDLPENSRDYQLGRKVALIFTPVAPGAFRAFICTGFLVGPDLLMTNHHCVHDDFGRPYPLELIQIYMDYYQEQNVDPTRGGVTAGVTAVLQADAPKDYALLRLDKPIGDTYGWLELDTTTRVDSSQSVKLISHNQGRSKEIVRRNSQIVDIPAGHPLADVPFSFVYLADTEGGSSGSPVFLRDGTGVIGINHSSWFYRGEPSFNAGSLMSHIVPEIQAYLPRGAAPDLAVGSPRVSKEFLRPGESFTLSVTVRNQGTVAAQPTTLRFYRSSDSTITPSDVEVGSVPMPALTPNATTELDITLTAPTFEGTYNYGGCVDAVNNETATYNNCSAAVSVNVSMTPPFWMYWASDGGLLRAINDGTNLQTLVTFATGGCFQIKIALDVEGGKMYWTDSGVRGAGKIQRANLDGSNIKDIITGLPFPYGIALDVAARKMYWMDFDRNTIQRANLDGSHVEDLVSKVDSPRGIALDVANGKMYWTNRSIEGSGKIQRANLDGTKVEDLVTTRLDWPYGIALDIAGGKMYWTLNTITVGDDDGVIQRANLDGSHVEDLVSGFDSSVGLALDVANGKMYWTNIHPSKIQRANLDGSHVEDVITLTRRPCDLALGISLSTLPSPIAPLTFNPSTIAGQRYTANTPITPLTLPVATGGTPPYTYTLSPVPAGLAFTAASRSLSGTPTIVGTTDVTYTAIDDTGESTTLTFTIEVIEDGPGPRPLDVNGDGQVDVLDLVRVAISYGSRGVGLPEDVNTDGVVNILDLTAVAQGIDAAEDGIHALSLEAMEAALVAAVELEGIAEAPAGVGNPSQHDLRRRIAYHNVAEALADARNFATDDVHAVLKGLLQLLVELGAIPAETALLPNYPNPFNPETWIPYHLATDAAVKLTIYDVHGVAVRTLMLGHQPAGIYESRGRAAYWDGRNQLGEPVASGLYFYTLTAGEFNATRKLLIIK